MGRKKIMKEFAPLTPEEAAVLGNLRQKFIEAQAMARVRLQDLAAYIDGTLKPSRGIPLSQHLNYDLGLNTFTLSEAGSPVLGATVPYKMN